MRDCSIQVSKYHDEQVRLPTAEQTRMRERRDANRERLKKGLKEGNKPSPIGCHSQGSYAMRTMVQDAANDFDIDDGIYFEESKLVGPNGGKLTPLQVRQMVCDALQDPKFKKSPEVLKNCVRVYYEEGHHVDVPSYRRLETKNQWDGKVTYVYELASADWKASDALEVTNWFKAQNKALSPDPDTNGGQFRRTVRLLKKFARSRPSWKENIATGFMITKLAQEKFVGREGRDDQALRDTMNAIRNRLVISESIDHPILPGEKLTKEGDGRPAYLRERLEENLKYLEVLDKNSCTHNEAMKAWDSIFNTDWFSSQPEPGGKESAPTSGTPSKAVEKKGGGRYA